MMDRTDRLAGGFAGALLLGGIAIGLLQIVIPGTISRIETAVPASVLVSVVVGLLGVLAVVSLRESGTQQSYVEPLVTGLAPERPKRPPAIVGDEFTTAVSDAAQAVRVRQVDPEETGPYQRLYTTAVSVVSRARDCSSTEAETLVESGDWTDDPVARAFLSPTATHPRWFRLLRWARPELAYERGVFRTITAIQSIAVADVPGYTSQTEHGASGNTESLTADQGVIGTLRTVLGASSSVRHRGDRSRTHADERSATPTGADTQGSAREATANGATANDATTVEPDHPESTTANADTASNTRAEDAALTDGEAAGARTEATPHE